MQTAESILLTTEDYRALGEGPPWYQLVEGELLMSPSPERLHQKISQNLERIFDRYLEKNPLGEYYHAPSDVELDEHNIFQPDIYFVSNARRSIFTKQGVTGAPDLVVEILSPRTAQLDLNRKRQVYARCGVVELWIVVPDTRQVQIYRLQENPTRPTAIHEQTDTFRSALLPDLEINAAKIFVE